MDLFAAIERHVTFGKALIAFKIAICLGATWVFFQLPPAAVTLMLTSLAVVGIVTIAIITAERITSRTRDDI